MKKIKLVFALFVISLFAFSCKKEHVPTSTTGTPEFYFNGAIAGAATSLNAGINNYYMYPSYTQDSNNVYNFIGDLKQTTSYPNSIQIQINDYKVSALNASVNIDSSLTIGNYLYCIPGTVTTTSTTVYKVQFNSSFANGTAQTYNWNFGDNTTSNQANPMHTYSQLGYYNVCLNITGTNSCSNGICDTVNLASPTAYACHTVVSSTVIPNTTGVTFSNTPSGTPPFNYYWNFGDTITSVDTATLANPTHYYHSSGTYQASLKVTDFTGKTAIAKYNVTTASAPQSCLTNFSVANIQAVTTTTTTNNNALGLRNIVVTWTDALGNLYTSKNAAQPASSSFQIVSIDNYQNNANNQRTKKLHVKFSCWVYNSTHPPKQITNADAVIAVAYK
jgi:PKD repeat protein